MKTYKGTRLHIAAALMTSLKLVKELLIPLLVIFVTHGFSRSGMDSRSFYWRLAIGAAVVGGSFLWGFLSWARFRYKLEDGQLMVDEGVIFKKKLSIPVTRIQTVDFSEGLLHRMLGLVKVQIQTAGGSKPEAVLSAVTRAEAARLEECLRHKAECAPEQNAHVKEAAEVEEIPAGVEQEWNSAGEQTADASHPTASGPAMPAVSGSSGLYGASTVVGAELSGQTPQDVGPVGPVPPEVSYSLPVRLLFLAGLTAGNLGVGISLLFALLSQADDFFPSLQIFRLLSDFSGVRAILVLGSIVVFLAWLLAVASSVLRFAGFVVSKRGGELYITRGLLERSKVTLPIRRIQAVRITQELVWKPFGLGAVHVVCAGYGTEKGESTLLFPLMPMSQIGEFLGALCPEFAVDPDQLPIEALPSRAKWSYVLPVPLTLMAITAITSLFTAWGLWGIPVTAAGVLLNWRSYRRASIARDDSMLVLRSAFLTETVAVIPRKRIQYLSVLQSPFQRRSGLATMKASLAGAGVNGTHFRLKGLYLTHALEILEQSGGQSVTQT
jgi:putative membrane protein